MALSMNEQTIAALSEEIRGILPPERLRHVLETEKTAARIASVYLPEKIFKIRAAALLHDITKAEPLEKQLQYCEESAIIISKYDLEMPQILHAITGAAVAERRFATYTDEEILSAIRWHTTGRDGMSVMDSIVYLADLIEESRTYESCRRLREYFWGNMPKTDDKPGQVAHLCRTMVYSLDLTMQRLLQEGRMISADSVLARNCFLNRLQMLSECEM